MLDVVYTQGGESNDFSLASDGHTKDTGYPLVDRLRGFGGQEGSLSRVKEEKDNFGERKIRHLASVAELCSNRRLCLTLNVCGVEKDTRGLAGLHNESLDRGAL